MEKRPLSVTIIAWFLIVASIFSAFALWNSLGNSVADQIMAQSPLPRSVQIGFGAFSLVFNLIIGVGLLARQNWARYAYVGLGLLGIVLGFFTSPLKSMILVNVIVLAVIAFFLFRKPADRWFRGTPA